MSGYRLILIGTGVSAFMLGVVGYLLTRANLSDARQAMHWLVGSVGQSGATELRILTLALLVLVPAAVLPQRHLRALELGDDVARGLGTRVERSRFALIAVSVVLTGPATAVAGPIVFVALVAGPVANRLLGPATDLLLLDEPTTFLDIAHQVELLRLLRDLNAETGKTIVVVHHDLNLACRYVQHVIAMADGHVVTEGTPTEVVTPELVEKVFGLACVVVPDPVAGTPMVVPADDGAAITPTRPAAG